MVPQSESVTGSNTYFYDPINETLYEDGFVLSSGDNAGAYYGDYSQEIYQYLLNNDVDGNLDDINNAVSVLPEIVTNILVSLVFFIFLFFSFKFIRLKGLDL